MVTEPAAAFPGADCSWFGGTVADRLSMSNRGPDLCRGPARRTRLMGSDQSGGARRRGRGLEDDQGDGADPDGHAYGRKSTGDAHAATASRGRGPARRSRETL